jgi:hypothetical protein
MSDSAIRCTNPTSRPLPLSFPGTSGALLLVLGGPEPRTYRRRYKASKVIARNVETYVGITRDNTTAMLGRLAGSTRQPDLKGDGQAGTQECLSPAQNAACHVYSAKITTKTKNCCTSCISAVFTVLVKDCRQTVEKRDRSSHTTPLISEKEVSLRA